MPASVSTPSTSTHSRRTLRARSDTVTALHELPVERFSWQQRVRLDLHRCNATDQSLEVVGWNAIAGALRGQHVCSEDRTDRNVFSGDDALAQSHANRHLRGQDGFVARAERDFNV